MLNIYVLIMIIAAIVLAIAAEVLIAYEKYSLKKRMKEELDEADSGRELGGGRGDDTRSVI